MKYGFWTILCAVCTATALIVASGVLPAWQTSLGPAAMAAEADAKKPSGPPPLVIDKDTPLLLDEPPEEDPQAVPKGPRANNTSCYVCHINYEEEPFAQRHAKANVGCIKCHGKSLDHRNDEDNITPPDVMFPAKKIAKACGECHERHNAPAAKVIARWQKCCPEKTNPKELVCTDCHGKHRLTHRTVRWNKATGELLPEKNEKNEKPAKE